MKALFAILLFAAGAWAQTTDYLLVLNKSSNSLSLVNLTTMKAEGVISVGQQPHEIAITPDGTKAYVSNVGSHTVSVVDLTRRREIRQIRSENFRFPHGLAFTGDLKRAIVTSEQRNKIVLIDPLNDEIVSTLDTDQQGTHMVVLSPDSGWAYLTNRGSNTVSIMDVNTAEIVSNVAAGAGVEGIALSPDGRQIWAANRTDNTVTVIDVEKREVLATVPAGRGPIRVAFSPDGKRAYIPAGSSNELIVYDTATRKQVKAVPLGPNPGGVAVSPDGSRIFVSCGGSNDVHVIDAASLTVKAKVPVERSPDGLAIWSAAP